MKQNVAFLIVSIVVSSSWEHWDLMNGFVARSLIMGDSAAASELKHQD